MLPGSRAPPYVRRAGWNAVRMAVRLAPDVGVSVRLPDARVVRVDEGYLQFLTGAARRWR